MNLRALALSITALAVFSACSGSGTSPSGSGATLPAPMVQATSASTTAPTTAPTVAPTLAPTAAPTMAALAQAAFITPSRGSQSGFATSNGFAVYIFDLDLTTPGTSSCLPPVAPATVGCTTFWPPVAPPAGIALVAPFGTIVRPDGTRQLAYNNHPLYNYALDTTAASATGDGVTASGGLWHLAQPQSAALATPLVAATATPTPAPVTLPYASTRSAVR